ncbi:carboxymuconolactone decarboxylase family protein [Nonomuraea sp. NPDC050404]|uniref:carboxymuconolactone decarboxylase family protein n=1 Tax=Nonomuraea sp. NPDC050404 TaxID=3155783 RepID=UPI0033C66754
MNASRLDLVAATPEVFETMTAFDGAAAGGLDPLLAELVRLRVSQINGCAFCLNLHTRAALSAGEDEGRLRVLAAWRASESFTPAERAALELAERMTLVAAAGVPGEVLAAAREHFDEVRLAHLLWTIAAINAWNRVAIAAAGQGEDG